MSKKFLAIQADPIETININTCKVVNLNILKEDIYFENMYNEDKLIQTETEPEIMTLR